MRGKVISWPLLWPLRSTSAQLIFQDGRCTCTYVSKNLTCTVIHHIMQPGLDHVFSKIGSLVFYRNINRNKMLYFTYASSIYKFYWNLKKKVNQMRGTMNLVYMHLQGLWKNCCGSKEDLLRINTFLLFGWTLTPAAQPAPGIVFQLLRQTLFVTCFTGLYTLGAVHSKGRLIIPFLWVRSNLFQYANLLHHETVWKTNILKS